MSREYELPTEYETLSWRKRLSAEYCRQIRYYAERDGAADHPLMKKLISEADAEAVKAARLYEKYIRNNPRSG